MRDIGQHYAIVEKLGQGGMGDVYRGIDRRTDKPVAIKHLRAGISDDPQMLERFRREGQALSELNHPNIVKMLDMIQHDSENYLIMEYLDGGDLSDMIREWGKLPLDTALKMALELTDALSRAHHLGIIHRDIKPGNVLIAPDGTPRLTDFGVAHIDSQERLTGTGMAVGTLDYLPPEALNGEHVDQRGDIWAFGVMLFEMLTGSKPFAGTTNLAVMTSILRDPAPELGILCPEAPPELAELVEQMLQKDKDDRIRSVRQVGAALESVLHGDKSGPRRFASSTPPRPAPMPPTTTISASALESDAPASPAPQAARTRWLRWGIPTAALVLLGVISAALLVPGGMLNPNPTATPEPTATVAPLIIGAYRDVTLDEASFRVPSTWAAVNVETIFESVQGILGDSVDNWEPAFAMIEQMRAQAVYMDLLNQAGVGLIMEDLERPLTDQELIERYLSLVDVVGTTGLNAEEFVAVPAGRALHSAVEIPGLGMVNDCYAIQQNNSVYMMCMVSSSQNTARFQPVFRDILNSLVIGEPLPAATPLPQSTPPPVVENPPEGYQWVNVDELRLAVPQTWVRVPDSMVDVFMSTMQQDDTTGTAIWLKDFLDQQRAWAMFVDWTSFTAVVAMIEETPLVMPEEGFEQRAQTLAAASMALTAPETGFIDLPAGRTFYTRFDTPPTGNSPDPGRQETYSLYHGTTLYSLSFNGASAQFAANREMFDTILASVQVDSGAAPLLTPEATPELPEIPDDWQYIQAPHSALAVPKTWLVVDANNTTLITSLARLLIGSGEGVEDMTTLFSQVGIEVMAANLQEIVFAAAIYQTNAIPTDLEVAGDLVRGLFENFNSPSIMMAIESSHATLPAGDAIRLDMNMTTSAGQFRNISFILVSPDGLSLYGLSISAAESKYEESQALFEQIIQSYRILD